jgi:hypothetical protein
LDTPGHAWEAHLKDQVAAGMNPAASAMLAFSE